MTMRKLLILTFAAALVVGMAFGMSMNSAAAGEKGREDIAKHAKCPFCNMDRLQWAHSRMLVEYEDGTSVGTCSLRCLAVDLVNNLDKFPKTLGVGDYNTKELIDAEKAVWVLGGDLPGVMTKRAKWAFADKAAAETFVKQHGGEPTDFDGAIEAAFDDINEDTKMIRERRKAKREKMKQEAPKTN